MSSKNRSYLASGSKASGINAPSPYLSNTSQNRSVSTKNTQQTDIQTYLNHRTRLPAGFDPKPKKVDISRYTVKRPDQINNSKQTTNNKFDETIVSLPSKSSTIKSSSLYLSPSKPRPVNVLQALYSPTKPEETLYQCVPTPSQAVIVKSPKKDSQESFQNNRDSPYFYSPSKTQSEIQNMSGFNGETGDKTPSGNKSFVSTISQTNNRVTKTRSRVASQNQSGISTSPSKFRRSPRRSSSNAPTPRTNHSYVASPNNSLILNGSPMKQENVENNNENNSIISEQSSETSPIKKKRSVSFIASSAGPSILEPQQTSSTIVDDKLKSLLKDVLAEEEVSEDEIKPEKQKKQEQTSPEVKNPELIPTPIDRLGKSVSLDTFDPQIDDNELSLSSLQNQKSDESVDILAFDYYYEDEEDMSVNAEEERSISEYKKESEIVENISEIPEKTVRPSNATVDVLNIDSDLNQKSLEPMSFENLQPEEQEKPATPNNISDIAHQIIDDVYFKEEEEEKHEEKEIVVDKKQIMLQFVSDDELKDGSSFNSSDKFIFEEDKIDSNENAQNFDEEEFSDVESSLCNHNPSILDVNELVAEDPQKPRMVDANDLEEESIPSEKDELNKCQVVEQEATKSEEIQENKTAEDTFEEIKRLIGEEEEEDFFLSPQNSRIEESKKLKPPPIKISNNEEEEEEENTMVNASDLHNSDDLFKLIDSNSDEEVHDIKIDIPDSPKVDELLEKGSDEEEEEEPRIFRRKRKISINEDDVEEDEVLNEEMVDNDFLNDDEEDEDDNYIIRPSEIEEKELSVDTKCKIIEGCIDTLQSTVNKLTKVADQLTLEQFNKVL